MTRHARENHTLRASRLKRGDRPYRPKYSNWREILLKPWDTKKVPMSSYKPPSETVFDFADEQYMLSFLEPISSEFCPSTNSDVKDNAVPDIQSQESFIQRNKEYKSEISSANRLGRRIGKQKRVLMKPMKLLKFLGKLKIREKKMQKTKRHRRKMIFWL